MPGIVIVSHSRPLALALAELVKQVSSPDIPLAIAAGVGPDRQEFGTDAVEIAEAIQSVYSPEGVLVLMDLGSAVLSAEMAVELLPEELRSAIRFCPAPMVEGAIAAGVMARVGADLQSLCQEAEGALQAKQEQLGASAAEAAPAVLETATPTTAQEVRLKLTNRYGLHARPAARFVQTASGYQAKIEVRNLTSGKGPVTARSLNALATLGAVGGDEIAISAEGPEAGQALEALRRLVESAFGEDGEPEPALVSPPAERPEAREVAPGEPATAIPISAGIALGPFYRYQAPLPPIPDRPGLDPQQEWETLQAALEAVAGEIRKRRTALQRSLGQEQAAIFDAHLLILQDPDLIEAAHQRIFTDRMNPALAWHTSIQEVAARYRELSDPYLQQRAVDVEDIGRQVLFALLGQPAVEPLHFDRPVILFADELTVTETSRLDMSSVLGLVMVSGGTTSHSAILARALGLPAVSGASPALADLPDGTLVALDGGSGEIWVDPPAELQAQLTARRQAWLAERRRLLDASQGPARTTDGRAVEVAANAGSLADAQAAVLNGAEAIGLLRTEFLFLDRETPPTEAEQLTALREIGEAMQGRPVIVRTLDVGGDKPLPFFPIPQEANPFLGTRAIRLSVRHPQVFLEQLRAILRAGVSFPLRIMFPMVAAVEELEQARGWLEQAHTVLQAEGTPHLWPVETGIMIEVPSAAILAEQFAPSVDFFSIGTNDLTQYTLAAERGNPALNALADALHPAVLRLIHTVVESAHRHGKWVGVCGELAGDPQAAPILIGLGVDELSLNPDGIPRIKHTIRSLSYAQVQELAQRALQLSSAAEVRKLVAGT